ncbi:hypothetical protein DFH06DRAFT_1303376 [Mycena polygramma]|nr:hypothetical protein DFH06DRAFT_1303376 [Mycena polygramma]
MILPSSDDPFVLPVVEVLYYQPPELHLQWSHAVADVARAGSFLPLRKATVSNPGLHIHFAHWELLFPLFVVPRRRWNPRSCSSFTVGRTIGIRSSPPSSRLYPTLHSKIIQIDAQRAALRQKLDDCRTFQAPIRRLPSEIVAEIFKLTVAATPEPQQALVDASLIERFIGSRSLHFLRCPSIALGTPALWSKIHLDPALWRSVITTEKALALFQSALARGANHPLTVVVSARYMSPSHHIPAFTRLAEHSGRWRSATFECPFSYLSVFSGIKGNLPMLETLTITPTLDMTPPTGTDIFEIAPRLRDFAVRNVFLPFVHTAPLAEIQHIRSLNLASEDIAMAVSTMPRLSIANRFTLQFYLDDFTSNRSRTLELGIQPTSSDVGQLKIEIEGEFFTHHCHQALGAIFAALTLPRLEGLDFESEQYPRFPLAWPQPQFLTLAQRSAFYTTLRSLCLFHVHITETQLLQCLAALPALTNLAIADHERIRGGGANVGRGVNLELVWTRSSPR